MSTEEMTKKEIQTIKIAGGIIAGAIAIIVVVGIASSPLLRLYAIWEAEQIGKAEYAKAEQNRSIAVLEARARNESATSEAEAKIKIAEAEATAEVARARGIAEANTIIGNSLKDKTEYLHYLWIQQLKEGNTIYVPTEANLPLTEAGRNIVRPANAQ